MENERSLTERFAAIESKLADSKVLLELGKANELPFFIFDYDPSNGGYEKSDDFETQFLVICTYLQNAENALTMAHVHAIELEEMYRNSYINRSLSELKYKLGIGQSNNYGNNNNGTNFSNHFNQNSNNSNNFVAGSNVENGGEISGGDRLTLEDFE